MQEIIKVSKNEFEALKRKAEILEELEEKLDINLLLQFTSSLEDLKHGRFKKLA